MASRAGRGPDYVVPTFNPNERNTYLFRSLFLFAYIGIGIDIVQTFMGIPIMSLLDKNEHPITDEAVRKMIWLILNFKRILEQGNTEHELVELFNSGWIPNVNRFLKAGPGASYQDILISDSIAILTVRVFASFQHGNGMILNPNLVGPASDAASDDAAAADIMGVHEIVSAGSGEAVSADTTHTVEIIEEMSKFAAQHFTSPRLAARAAAAAARAAAAREAAEAARAAAAAEAARAADQARNKLAEYTRNLKNTTLKRFPIINLNILTNKTHVADCNDALFYKSLPIMMMRMKTCLPLLLNNKDVSKEPGSVGTLIALGLTVRGGGAEARDLFEHKDPIPQCDNTVGNYHKYVNPSCYICGQVWISDQQDSMECEHILCVIHAIEYFGLLQSVFFSDNQKRFLSMLYAWAHRCCNQRKGNIAFIRRNQNVKRERGNYFVPDDVNIRKLLEDIFASSHDRTKEKLDCPVVLKKVTNKPKFVNERTKAVTSYVMPLVDCINTVYTGLFAENMMLFNAVGCLKKIAELCIHLTSRSHSDRQLLIEFNKTHDCMGVLFPGYVPSHQGGANHRSVSHSKNKKKSLRHKIQHGGVLGQEIKSLIVESIRSVVEQEKDNSFLQGFNDSLHQTLEEVSPSPTGLPDSSRLPRPTVETESLELNNLLFILFILNHYRNPDVLFSLFFQPIGIPVEQQAPQQSENDANNTAFVNICQSVFPTINTIIPFLQQSEMIPSFMGVLNFCVRRKVTTPEVEAVRRELRESPQSTAFGSVFEQFDGLCHNLLVSSTDFNVYINNDSTPLDYLMMACFYLKECLSEEARAAGEAAAKKAAAPAPAPAKKAAAVAAVESAVDMLKDACNLFPQCYNSELENPGQLFSYFGPCNVYLHGTLLQNDHFQLAMGFFALAKNTEAHNVVQDINYAEAVTICKDFFPEYQYLGFTTAHNSPPQSQSDDPLVVNPEPPSISDSASSFATSELSISESESSSAGGPFYFTDDSIPEESLSPKHSSGNDRNFTSVLQPGLKRPNEFTLQNTRRPPPRMGGVYGQGGSSTLRRKLRHNHRRTQYTKKHKRSSKHATIKHRKSYRKHNRTIKRRKNSRRRNQ